MNRPFFYAANIKGKKGEKLEGVFAIYNGKHWYTPSKSGWKRIRHEAGDFYCNLFFQGIVVKEGHEIVNVSTLMFGLVGGLIDSMATEHHVKNVSGRCLYVSRLSPSKGKFSPIKRLGY